MLITPQHQQLLDKYNAVIMRDMQHNAVVNKKDEQIRQLSSEVTLLKNAFDQLKQIAETQQQQIASLIQANAQKDKQIEKLQITAYQYEILKKMVFDRSSEKSHHAVPDQLALGLEAEVVEACNINDGQRVKEHTKHKAKNENHPGRNQIPEHIPKEYIDIYPENLPEGAQLYDKEETEQLEYDPAKLFATVYRRHKYKLVMPDGSVQFFIGELPAHKDKSIAAPSLKAHMAVEKYMYHTPIYRLLQKFSHHGIDIAQSTACDWISNVAHCLLTIYDAHRHHIIYAPSKYLMADETTLRVLDSDKPKGKKSHIGYIWAYCNPVDKLVFFEYQRGRGNKHARSVLEKFTGELASDGYNVYKHYGQKDGINHSCCNSHSRRKFDDAKLTDKKRAEHVIALYGKLYAVEGYARENRLNADERLIIRQAKSVPVFEQLAAYIKEQRSKIIKAQYPIEKAFNYFLEREKELSMFLHNGMLEIDTNIIENTIRPIVIGKKNYLFAGSHDAAQNAAIIYSLFATCRLHNINPYDWLKYVLTVIPAFPASRISELLPQNWKREIK